MAAVPPTGAGGTTGVTGTVNAAGSDPVTGVAGSSQPPAGAGTTGVTGTVGAGSPDIGTGVKGTFPGVPGATWDSTPQGAAMAGGYHALRFAYTVQMPSLRQQLDLLAHRPIGG